MRNAALRTVPAPAREDFGELSPDIIDILKNTYRAAYMFSILKRDKIIAEGRAEKLGMIIDMARMAHVYILIDSPE